MKVHITLTDTKDSSDNVNFKMDFDPPMSSEEASEAAANSPAVALAGELLEYLSVSRDEQADLPAPEQTH